MTHERELELRQIWASASRRDINLIAVGQAVNGLNEALNEIAALRERLEAWRVYNDDKEMGDCYDATKRLTELGEWEKETRV